MNGSNRGLNFNDFLKTFFKIERSADIKRRRSPITLLFKYKDTAYIFET